MDQNYKEMANELMSIPAFAQFAGLTLNKESLAELTATLFALSQRAFYEHMEERFRAHFPWLEAVSPIIRKSIIMAEVREMYEVIGELAKEPFPWELETPGKEAGCL